MVRLDPCCRIPGMHKCKCILDKSGLVHNRQELRLLHALPLDGRQAFRRRESSLLFSFDLGLVYTMRI